MTKLQRQRLKYLADRMAKLPASADKHFGMRSWFEHYGDHDHHFGKRITRRDLHKCGTAACAIGWAATMPFFNKLGVFVTSVSTITKYPSQIFGYESSYLFGPDHPAKTPKQWAKAAREFLKQMVEP